MNIIIIFCFILLTKEECIVKDDSYLIYNPKNIPNFTLTIEYIYIRTPSRLGWSSISFHKNQTNFNNSLSFLSYFDSNFNTITMNVMGNTSTLELTKNIINNSNVIEYNNVPFFGDDLLRNRYFYNIKLNNSLLLNYNYFTIQYNDYTPLYNITYLTEPTYRITLELNFSIIQHCNSITSVNLDTIHISMTILKPFYLLFLFLVMFCFSIISSITLCWKKILNCIVYYKNCFKNCCKNCNKNCYENCSKSKVCN